MKELDDLLELEKRATQGRWISFPKNSRGMTGVHGPDCKIYHAPFESETLKETHDRQRRDAELITSMRNCIRELVEVARAADEFANSYRNQNDHLIRGISTLGKDWDDLESKLTKLERKLKGEK